MFSYEPKVSIVIPAYNASNYLAEAIESALAQTYRNFEIIVVNDGSKDDGATAEVAAKYSDQIRYFEKENGGSSSALNAGIANMEGEWFSWLSHDDLYEPTKLEKQIGYLNDLQTAQEERYDQVLFCASECIDACGKKITKANSAKNCALAAQLAALRGNEYLMAEPTRYIFNGCSCLVHKSVFQRIGVFDEGLRLLNDVDMWYRIYAHGFKIHYLPEVLVYWRIHDKQVSRSAGYSYHNPEQDRHWKGVLQWLTDHHPDNPDLFFLYGRNAYLKTRNEEAQKAFAIVASLNPKQRTSLFVRKIGYKLYANTRNLAKRLILRLRT